MGARNNISENSCVGARTRERACDRVEAIAGNDEKPKKVKWWSIRGGGNEKWRQ